MKKITQQTWKKGIITGFDTTWTLAKVIFPITLIISILKYTPVIEFLTEALEPVMAVFGLNGDASIVLVLGNLLNLYAAIGAVLTMEMTVKQVFILAVMLSFSHNLFIETAITTRIGVSPLMVAGLRLGMGFFFGFAVNLIWQGGQDIAQYGLIPASSEVLTAWPDIFLHAVQTAVIGILQVAAIVIPVMIMIQLLKDVDALPLIAKFMNPFTRLLGVSNKTSVTLLAGMIFGIAYGAGVIIQTAKEENLSKRDIYLVSIFLITCHAVVEDTLIFLPLGVNVLALLLIRIVFAMLITFLTARFWEKVQARQDDLKSSA